MGHNESKQDSAKSKNKHKNPYKTSSSSSNDREENEPQQSKNAFEADKEDPECAGCSNKYRSNDAIAKAHKLNSHRSTLKSLYPPDSVFVFLCSSSSEDEGASETLSSRYSAFSEKEFKVELSRLRSEMKVNRADIKRTRELNEINFTKNRSKHKSRSSGPTTNNFKRERIYALIQEEQKHVLKKSVDVDFQKKIKKR